MRRGTHIANFAILAAEATALPGSRRHVITDVAGSLGQGGFSVLV
jgi:hypothetical protein